MQRYKRLLVALDLSEQDGTTIQYAALVSRLARSEEIYFVHVVQTLDISADLQKEYLELSEPVDEFVRGLLNKEIEDHFDGHPDTVLKYEIVEGARVVELLRLSRRKNIDLVIAGKKPKKQGGGTIPEKLARKAPCSVLIVPKGSPPDITSILVPIDFSEHAANAVTVATDFGSGSGATSIECLHVYHVPTGHYKIGKSFDEFAAIMKRNAERNFNDFISGIDLGRCSVKPLFELHDKPAKAIQKVVSELQPDLLVMGNRGRGAAVLLGSVVEHTVLNTEIPLLAVKEKGETFGLLDAFLEL